MPRNISALVVEQDHDLLDLLVRRLRCLGYAVTPTSGQQQTLNAAGRRRFQLALIDLDSPQAISLAMQLRAQFADICTILLTDDPTDPKFAILHDDLRFHVVKKSVSFASLDDTLELATEALPGMPVVTNP